MSIRFLMAAILLLQASPLWARFVLTIEEPVQPVIEQVSDEPPFKLHVVKEPLVQKDRRDEHRVDEEGAESVFDVEGGVAERGVQAKREVNVFAHQKNKPAPPAQERIEPRIAESAKAAAQTPSEIDAYDGRIAVAGEASEVNEPVPPVRFASESGESLREMLDRWSSISGQHILLGESANMIAKASFRGDRVFGTNVHEAVYGLATLLNEKMKKTGWRVAVVAVDDGLILEVL